MRDMKVVTQLVMGFTAIIMLLVGLGMFSLYEISAGNDHVVQLRDDWLALVRASGKMSSVFDELVLLEYGMAQAPAPEELRDLDARAEAAVDAYRHLGDAYEPLVSSPEERRKLTDVTSLMPRYLRMDRQIRALARDGRHADAMDLLTGSSSQLRGEMAARLGELPTSTWPARPPRATPPIMLTAAPSAASRR